MANKYTIYQAPTVEVVFAVEGVFTDPTTITLRIIDPDGIENIYTYANGEITKDSIGHFSKIIPGEKLGTWFYEWVGTGACIASYQYYYRIVSYMVAE
jgi:hypothetical protein